VLGPSPLATLAAMHRRLRAVAVAVLVVVAVTAGADKLLPSPSHAPARTEPGVVLARTGPALAPLGVARQARERLPLLLAALAAIGVAPALARRPVRRTPGSTRFRPASATAPSRAPPLLPAPAR
jgi:hypothetical protein